MKAKERHELKHDRFVEAMLAAGRYIEAHSRQVVAGVLAAAVLVGAILWGVSSRRAAHEERRARLHAAVSAVGNALREADQEAKEEALGKGLTRLRNLHDEYPGTPEALQALRFTADVYYIEEKHNRAIEAYREIVNAPQASPRFKALAKMSLATALEQTGQWLAASEIYRERTQAEAVPEEVARAWLDYARCMDRLDRREEAAAARRKAIETAPDSFWARMAAALAAMPEPKEQAAAPPTPRPTDPPGKPTPKDKGGAPDPGKEPPADAPGEPGKAGAKPKAPTPEE